MGNCVTVKKGDKDGATIENKKPPKAANRGNMHKDAASDKSDDKKHEKPESELPQSK